MQHKYKTLDIVVFNSEPREPFRVVDVDATINHYILLQISTGITWNFPVGYVDQDSIASARHIDEYGHLMGSIIHTCAHPRQEARPLATWTYQYCIDCNTDLGDTPVGYAPTGDTSKGSYE